MARKFGVFGKKKQISSLDEEQRLRNANIDPVTMCVCTKVALPHSSTGVQFRLPKSLAVSSNCELEIDELIKRSAGDLKLKGLNDKLINLREKLSCVEKLVWLTAHQHLKLDEYRYFRGSKEWGLSFIGSLLVMEVVKTD